MGSKYLIFIIFFVKITAISCKINGSLSLIIDDTHSMQYVIDSVKNESSEFMDIILDQSTSQISDVVIVTFNDPERSTLRLKSTKDRGEVKRALDKIHVDDKRNGGDCPEYSLTGINTALDASLKNSYLFVFTDASPKEGYVEKKYRRGNNTISKFKLKKTLQENEIKYVKNKAQSKNSQIFFFLMKSKCKHPEPPRLFEPYWDIAKETNGQVFNILNETTDLKQFLKYMDHVISGEGNVISRIEIEANVRTITPFSVDDQTEYVRVSASTKGDEIFLDISSGPTTVYETFLSTNNNKVLMIKNPPPGNYTATVEGNGVTTILFFGRTDFTFQHGFSDIIPQTFSNEKSQPVEAKESHLLIKVSDPKNSVDIKYVQISSLDKNNMLFPYLALEKQADGYYATRKFLAPSDTFIITVIGEGKRTGEPIKRTAKTPIEPLPQDKDPVISVQGGGRRNKYNTDVSLTCHITAYPEPKISWMDDKNISLPNPISIQKKGKKDFVTKLTIKNLKHKKVLYCCAENANGIIFRGKQVNLEIQTPFKVDNDYEASVFAELGKSVSLNCDITTDIPMAIDWIHIVNENYNKLDNTPGVSSEYSITDEGKKLTINKISPDYEGRYLCEAFIKDDNDTTYRLEKEININHTAPIMGKPASVKIQEGESQFISCTITQAYPKPDITWKFKDYKSKTFRLLHNTEDRFLIKNANYKSAGVYKCIASNDAGNNEQEITVNVPIRPITKLFINNDKTGIVIEYDSKAETVLTCIVISHTAPAIVWKNSENEVKKVDRDATKNNDYEYVSEMKISHLKKPENYYCEAANPISKTKSNEVQVDVSSPFRKEFFVNGTVLDNNDTKKANFREQFEIHCGISSYSYPVKFTWYKETGEIVHASDKYLMTKNGAVLIIKEVNSKTKGKYRCKASIIGDEATQEIHETTVDIIPTAPEFKKTENVEISEGGSKTILCNILKGYPEPDITWEFKNITSGIFTPYHETSDRIHINNIDFTSAGVYKCIARNSMGRTEQEIKLTVKIRPRAALFVNDDRTRIHIEYNNVKETVITCNILSHAPPTIVWKNGKNEILNLMPETTHADQYQHKSKIRISQLKKSETYYCEVSNEISTVKSNNVHIDVSKPFTKDLSVRDNNNTKKANFREEFKIHCGINSSYPVKFTWYKETGELVYPSDKYLITENGAVLILKEVNAQTKGKYRCKASIIGDEATQEIHETTVDIIPTAPEFKKTENVEISEGGSKTILCNILKGYPEPDITWEFKNIISGIFTPYYTTSDRIRISNVDFTSAGVYKCIARNSMGRTEQEIKVTVKIRPRAALFVNDDKTRIHIEYNNVKETVMSCNILSHSPPTIVWKNGKNDILNLMPETTNANQYQHKSKIRISHLKKSETYYCEVSNEISTVKSNNVHIDVSKPFTKDSSVRDNNNTKKANFREEFKIHCGINSSYPVKFTWYKETGEIVHASDKYLITKNGAVLIIKEVNSQTKGKYRCKASIIGDEATQEIHETTVDIIPTAPEFKKTENVEISEGVSKTILCNILKGYPEPDITWEFKNITSGIFAPYYETSDRIRINNIDFTSAGVYKCIARNSMGSTEQEIKVTVKIRPRAALFVNDDKTRIHIEYNNVKETVMSCNILSHSPPTIVWKNGKNDILNSEPETTHADQYQHKSKIRISQLKKSETYYCEVSNEISTVKSNNVHIDVSKPFTKDPSVRDNDTKSGNYGELIVIPCGIKSHLPIKITWFNEAGEIIPSDVYIITENGELLTIKKVSADTKGKYKCKASIIGDEATEEIREVTIDTVAEQPAVEAKYKELEVLRNEKASMKCKILKGIPRPKITWQVKYDRTNKFVDLPEVGDELIISSAMYNHSGLYKCVISNDLGSDEGTVRLFVKGPPEILTSNEREYTALVGDDSLVIPCDVAGYPKPEITWTPEFSSIHTKFSVNNSYLVINNPTTDDSDKSYKCTAINEFSTKPTVKEFYVVVSDEIDEQFPQDFGIITDVVVLKDSATHLNCEGRWYKQGHNLGKTGTLKVNTAIKSFDDEKYYRPTNYTCRTKDSDGSYVSKTYSVKIEHKPILKEPNDGRPKDIDWDGGDSDLSCEAFMRPQYETAEAKWYYNGVESHLSSGNAYQSTHPIISWGHYTCNISNYHGYVIKNFNVGSSKCIINKYLKGLKHPIMLDSTGSLPVEEGRYLKVESGEKLLLSCNNQRKKPNFFENLPNFSEVFATCDHEDKFTIEGAGFFNLMDMQCNSEVTPTFKATGDECSYENSELINVGYDVQQPESSFVDVYTVCYNKSGKVPIYSEVIITERKHNTDRIENPVWIKFDDHSMENLGEHCSTKDKNCCLIKTQLMNEINLEQGPLKAATYVDGLNSILYWNNCGTVDYTWSQLDDKIQTLNFGFPYSIRSGALNYYTSINGLMVPRYLYKWVTEMEESMEIVIVFVNDPSPKKRDKRCSYDCPFEHSINIFCCKVEEFKTAFDLSVYNL